MQNIWADFSCVKAKNIPAELNRAKKTGTSHLFIKYSFYWKNNWARFSCPLRLPYILVYKPTIFSWILTIKLCGSAYTRVIAQQPELARHGPLVGTCRLPPTMQTAAAVSAYQCGSLHCGGWTHRQMSAWMRGASACGAVIGVCAGCTGWQCTDPGYLFVADCRYRLIRGSLVFARLSDVGMGVGLYAERLIREYIRYVLCCWLCEELVTCTLRHIFSVASGLYVTAMIIFFPVKWQLWLITCCSCSSAFVPAYYVMP